jgi:membrane protein YdbS with pleckstrin-like domain
MTFSSEFRRLAWRTKYVIITVLLFLYSLAVLALQFVVFPESKEIANLANWSIAVLFLVDFGILSVLARRNVYRFRLHVLNTPPCGA